MNKLIYDLYKYFLARQDYVAVTLKGRIFPVKVTRNIRRLLHAHVNNKEILFLEKGKNFSLTHKGIPRCGTYSINTSNTTNHACIDFDGGKNHSNPLKNPLEDARRVYYLFKEYGITTYPEISYSGEGYHLWVFFDKPLPASQIRQAIFTLLPRDLVLISGDMADPTAGKGVEVFPKQDTVKETGLGSMVFLPFHGGAREKANKFIDFEKNDRLYWPEHITLISEAKVQYVNSKKVIKQELVVNTSSTDTVWKIWRRKVLEKVNLRTIYGEWLTGETNGDWLTCRDPFSSPTGDRDPSSGVYNSDVEFERGCWHSFISGETLSIFDFIRKQGLCEDTHIEACKYIAELTKVNLPNNFMPSKVEGYSPPGGGGDASAEEDAEPPQLPNIVVNRQFRDILDDSWQVLLNANTHCPTIFSKSNLLVTIFDHKLKFMAEVDVFGFLGRHANWIRLSQSGGCTSAMPVKDVAKDILYCEHEGRTQLPLLDATIQTPIFTRTRELITQNGYNASGRVWAHMPEELINMGTIDKIPSQNDVEIAKAVILDELLCDFPFVSEPDIAHTFAAMFLPFIRQLIDGPTPLHIIEAPAPGTGKSKICNLINIIFTGEDMKAMTLPVGEEEIRKKLTSTLMEGRPIICIDNAKEKTKIDSSALASILTLTTWEDRVLGMSKMINLPNLALWMLTGNNPLMSLELARRSIRIRLDAKMDRPWKRKAWKHQYIEQWAKDNRITLIKSLLVLIQNWISNSCPLSRNRLGSFENWSAIMGGILEINGIPGFLANLDELYEASDIEGAEWRAFIIRWYAEYGEQEKSSDDLYTMCDQYGLLEKVLGDTGGMKFRLNRLQEYIKTNKDKKSCDCTIGISKNKAHTYYLIKEQNKCLSLQNETVDENLLLQTK